MNIFYLDENPKKAAQYHCDKHVVKMVVEYHQILCTVLHKVSDSDKWSSSIPYKATHRNHPCTIWAGENIQNFSWLLSLAYHSLEEYRIRYGKVHKSSRVLNWIVRLDNLEMIRKLIPRGKFTSPPLAMPVEYRNYDDPVNSYRQYYIFEKSGFAKWDHSTKEPEWYLRVGTKVA